MDTPGPRDMWRVGTQHAGQRKRKENSSCVQSLQDEEIGHSQQTEARWWASKPPGAPFPSALPSKCLGESNIPLRIKNKQRKETFWEVENRLLHVVPEECGARNFHCNVSIRDFPNQRFWWDCWANVHTHCPFCLSLWAKVLFPYESMTTKWS